MKKKSRSKIILLVVLTILIAQSVLFSQHNTTLKYADSLYHLSKYFAADFRKNAEVPNLLNEAKRINEIHHPVDSKRIGEIYIQLWKWYGNNGQLVKAQQYLEFAKSMFVKVAPIDTSTLAMCHRAQAVMHLVSGKLPQTKSSLDSAFYLESKNKGNSSLFRCYSSLGQYYEAIGQTRLALAAYRNSETLFRIEDKADRLDLANLQVKIADIYVILNQIDSSNFFLEKGLAILNNFAESDHPYLSTAYRVKGSCYFTLWDYDNALKFYDKYLDLTRLIYGENNPNTAIAYGFPGHCYMQLGRYDAAIVQYTTSLEKLFPFYGENNAFVARLYSNIGTCLSRKGENDEAVVKLLKAKNIYDKLTDATLYDKSLCLESLGTCYFAKKDYDLAIQTLEKAKSLLQSANIYSFNLANTYFKISGAYFKIKNFEKAFDGLKTSLSILEKLPGDNSLVINDIKLHIALWYVEVNRIQEAEEHLSSSYENYQLLNDSGNKNVNRFLYFSILAKRVLLANLLIGKNAGKDQYKVNVIRDIKHLDQMIDDLRFFYTDEANRLHFENNLTPIWENLISTTINLSLLDIDYATEAKKIAYKFVSKSKSSILQQIYNDNLAKVSAKVPIELVERERGWVSKIRFFENKYNLNMASNKFLSSQIESNYTDSLRLAKIEYKKLASYLETNYPLFAELKYGNTQFSIQEIQEKILVPGQTILEYFIGDSIYTITIIQKNYFDILTFKNDLPLNQWVEDLTRNGIYGFYGKKGVSKGKSINNFGTAAHQLYEALIAPVKAKLPKDEKLIIIPDGILGYVPFEALLTQKPPRPDAISAYKYLIQDHQISYCYSATLLKEMRNKTHSQEPTQKLLAMAPFFLGNADTLLSKVDSTELLTDVALRTRDTLTALPNSGPEVASINKILPGQAFYGKEATLQKFQELASRSRILHLSTHGKADDRLGDYAYLAFGMPNAEGTFEKLYARDLYNLSLNADLVVLSACETGIGKLQRGEGIVSLARAFAYAGAKSIVTTLWKVSDEQSKNLMTSFYKYLSKGKEKDEALRLAKLEFLQKNEKKTELLHPFFWASFIGIGDMRGLENSK